ncbi:phage tail spike protein, partial [Romboutsia sp. 1001713B170207_170306_H8]|uniref:phage tail spike protein n=1 Tax=Romboutsia sp. 1001713B170207_170306_H8 TaxID=2787112 RepID=UPI00189AE9DB
MNKKLVKICVFDKNSTPSAVITGNGDEILDNICISAISDEVLKTGEYYLDAVFLIDEDGLHNSINEEAILKVQLDYGNEYFRIAKVLKTSRDITVFARQITISETLDMWIEDVRPENQNGQGAISWIKDNSIGKKDINVYSDIQSTSTSYYMDMSMYEALHTSDNSFLERWGGEVQRRGYNLYINNRIGTHRGVQIRNNKNLTGFEASTNIDNIVTRIKPKGYDGITIPGFVDSPLINKYSSIKTKEIKYEDVKVKSENNDEGFNTLEEAQAELIKRAKLEFTQNHIDELRGEYRVNFVQLEQTEEYKNYVAAERVLIGDDVDVYEEKLGIDITVRAIRKQYDILRQKVIEVELSNNTENKKSPTINQVLNKIEEVKENNKWFEEAINNATDLIENGLKDSYVVHRKNEILIMDTTDINTATKVWRWNSGGLAHSSTGYYGKYSTAITQDGGIVATMISSGILNANLLKTGVIRNHNNDFEINLDDGTIKIKNNNF